MAEKGAGRMGNAGDLISQHSISREAAIRRQWEHDYADLLAHERIMMKRLKDITHENPYPANLVDPPTAEEKASLSPSYAAAEPSAAKSVGRRPVLSTTRQDLLFDDPKVPRHTATTTKADYAYRPSLELFKDSKYHMKRQKADGDF